MSPVSIPDELLELRQTLRDFIDREIRPVEESHRQEIQETATFESVPLPLGLPQLRLTEFEAP